MEVCRPMERKAFWGTWWWCRSGAVAAAWEEGVVLWEWVLWRSW